MKYIRINKKLLVGIQECSSQFGEGFTLWVNRRWILDASCFTKDLRFSIDNYRCKRVKHTEGRWGKDNYKFDKRKTK